MLNENLYYQIELTARKIRRYGQSVLDEYGVKITIEQWLVLKVVNENKGINQLEIGRTLVKDKPTISRMVKSLCIKGYLFKESSAKDLREFSVKLTEEGKKLMDTLLPIVEEIRLKGLNKLAKPEINSTSNTLMNIRNNLDN